MRPTLTFRLHADDAVVQKAVEIDRAIIAGWTARDTVAMQAHIEELAELGVARPARTPIFYRVAARRVTTAPAIEAVGDASSGEVEFFLINIDGEIWVGAGSDHTDRAAEVHGITLSKQMCDKPVAADLWRLRDVTPHWDRLELTAWIEEDGARIVYQNGPATTMKAPDDLMAEFASEDAAGGLQPGDLMMCGTLAAIGGLRSASHFAFSLTDPVLGREISHGYEIITLPDHG